MTNILKNCRKVPGWENVFLNAIKNGYNEKTAANAAGIGTAEVRKRVEKDEKFKKRYEDTVATKRARPSGGIWATFLAILFSSTLVACASVEEKVSFWQSGDETIVSGYCVDVDEKFMKSMTRAMLSFGMEAYVSVMQSDAPCYDVRYNGVSPANIILVKKLWSFTMDSGEILEVWEITDRNKTQGYTWIAPKHIREKLIEEYKREQEKEKDNGI